MVKAFQENHATGAQEKGISMAILDSL